MRYVIIVLLLCLCSCQTSFKKQKQVSLFLQITRGYLSKCRYPQALTELRKAARIDPESAAVQDALGIVYYLMKRYDMSVKYFLKAFSLTPSYTQAKVNLAQVFIKQKRLNEAIVLLKQAEDDLTYLNPAQLHLLIGEVYIKKKNYKKGSQYLTSSRQMNPNSCPLFLYLGQISFYKKKYSQAIQYFKKTTDCLRKEKRSFMCLPSLSDQYYFQALSELAIGKKQKARKTLSLFFIKSFKDHSFFSAAKKLSRSIAK